MANVKDAIKREVDRVTQENRGRVDILPIDTHREDFYHAGPPPCVFCRLPNGSSVRLALEDPGVESNELKAHPEMFGVKIDIPYYRLPLDSKQVVGVGALVKYSGEDREDLDPTIAMPAMGHRSYSGTVKEVSVGEGTLRIGERGEVQTLSRGKVVSSVSQDGIVERGPTNSSVLFGGNRRVIFSESFLGELLPKGFIPPFNTPNWLPDFTIVASIGEMMKELKDLARLQVTGG